MHNDVYSINVYLISQRLNQLYNMKGEKCLCHIRT